MRFQLLLAWRYLRGRTLRNILTAIAIFFGVWLIFTMRTFQPVMEESLSASIKAETEKGDLVISQKNGQLFNADLAEKVASTEGIAAATAILERSVYLSEKQIIRTKEGKALKKLIILGVDPPTLRSIVTIKLISGHMPAPGDREVIVINESLVKKTALKLNDIIRLPAARGFIDFKIIGVLPESPVYGDEEVFIPRASAESIFGLRNRATVIVASFIPGRNGKEVKRKVLSSLGKGFMAGTIDTGKDRFKEIFNRGDRVTTLFGVFSLIMAAFIIFNTFRTVVVERRRDIGMLRSIGAERGMILKIILIESLILGVIGTLLGIIISYLMLVLLIPFFNTHFWVPYFHTPLGSPSLSLKTLLITAAMGLGVPVLGVLWPMIGAMRISPLEALREKTEMKTGTSLIRTMIGFALIAAALLGLTTGKAIFLSIGAVIFIIGIVTVGPVLVRYTSIALGHLLEIWRTRESRISGANLVRHPERTSITASTVMISMAILIAMGGMTTTLTSGYRTYLNKSMHADFYLLPQSVLLGHGNVGAGPELSKLLRENPGVSSFTSIRYGETLYEKLPLRIIGIDPKTYPAVSGLLFSEGGPEKSYKALDEGRFMIVNGPMAAKNNLKTGDTITLDTPAGHRSYRIVGIGLDYMNFKLTTGYISHANLAADFFEHSDQLLMIDKKRDADVSALETSLLKIVKEYPAFSLMSGAVWRKSQVKIFKISRYTLYTLMLILALPSLIALANTLGINVLERIREIGMLRAIGATRTQIMRLIISESLFLTAMGLAVGVPAGIWFGYIAVYAGNMSGFVLEYFFPVAGITITLIIGLIFGTAAAVFPARQAARLNIVTALHYE